LTVAALTFIAMPVNQPSGQPVEVFVPLLSAGTSALRRTDGLVIGPNQVQLLAPADYNPNAERWQFPPGSRVTCVTESHGGRQLLVARHRIA
jgi:hypothetical protein